MTGVLGSANHSFVFKEILFKQSYNRLLRSIRIGIIIQQIPSIVISSKLFYPGLYLSRIQFYRRLSLKFMPREVKDSELAPDPEQEIYMTRPVQNFGLSLLQSMGFTKEKGIGKNKQNALQDLLILKPRPRGLGLGAEQEKQAQKPIFNPGNLILITQGSHQDLTGIILSVHDTSLLVQLTLSHSQVQVAFDNAKVITKAELTQLSKPSKQQQPQKKKRLKWVVPGIRVKVIDKNSSLYLKKVIVTDLISEREFQCLYETQSGNRVVRDLRQKDLQTVVPKPGQTVVILRGPQQGQKALVFQKDKKKEKIVVQTVNELQLLTLDEDDITQHVQL